MRKQIVIASVILIFVLLVVIFLSRPKPDQNNNTQVLPTPTTVPVDFQLKEQLIGESLPYTPYEDENFKFDYNSETNQFFVQEKTSIGRERFIEWANQNELSDLAANPELVIYENSATGNANNKEFLNFDPINDLLNIFLDLGKGINVPASTDSQTSTRPPSGNQSESSRISGLVYYAQCNSEYADLPLPDGCSMCEAGCGAATVAMIASSYLGKQYDPRNIVNQYKSKGYLLSCAGSRYSDARSILQSLGLRTTDYIAFNYETADQVVGDLRKYLKADWTFFTLANFKQGGGGHFFWITDIDEKGNIWAYDPYYGRFEAPPINENSRYPFPQYRLAFGVKK